MNAVIYVRVSTEGQEDGTSLDTQLEACLKRAVALGYSVPPEYRLRETYSGLKLDRATLNHARELMRSGKVSALICYTLDRLSRDPAPSFRTDKNQVLARGLELNAQRIGGPW